MADDNTINLVVTDNVDPAITPKLQALSTASLATADAVTKLNAAIAAVSSGPLAQLQAVISATASSTSALANATAQLSTANATGAINAANVATAQQRLTTAQQQTAAATQNAAAAQQKATAAATAAQTATQNLTTAQQRHQTALAQTATAQSNSATAALKFQQAQQAAVTPTQTLSDEVVALGLKLVTLWAAFGGVTAIGEAADEYTLLENKLRSVGVANENLGDVMGRLTDAAVASRTSIEATATTFQRLSVATSDLGLSQANVLSITKTLNESTAMSGATASQASRGLYQLAEGMEANSLQGQHLKALITDLPMLARQIATALGTNIDGLRKMGTAGTLSAKMLSDALVKIGPQVQAAFGNSVETVQQALTNLNSRFVEFVGVANTATGATGTLAKGIDFLGDHLGLAATAVAALGVALLAVFGPTLLAMLATATAAVVGFTLALLANPVGLFAVALTAVIGLLITYNQQITSATDSTVNLGDQAHAAASTIEDQFSAMGDALAPIFAGLGDEMGKPFKTFPQFIDQLLRSVFIAFTSIVPTVVALIGGLPDAFGQMMLNIGLKVAEGVESFVNFFIDGINTVTTYANNMIGNKSFDLTPKFVIDGKPAIQSGAWDKLAQDITTAQDAAVVRFDAAAKAASTARLSGAAGANTAFNQNGTAHPQAAPEDKNAEKRALAMQKVNDQLDRQLNGFGLLGPARAVQQQYDQIELQLAAKKITMTAAESAAIRAKIQTIQDNIGVQQQMDAIYTAAIAPVKTYADTITAATTMLAKGQITQAQYGVAVRNATDAYAKFLDPLYTTNQQLSQQEQLLGKVGSELTVAQQMQQIQNQLGAKWNDLSHVEIDNLDAKLTKLQQLTGVQQELNSIYASTTGELEKQTQTATALAQAYSRGMITAEQYSVRMNQLAVSAADTRLAMGGTSMSDEFLSSLGKMTKGYQGFVVGSTNAFGDFFATFEDGFASSIGKAITGTESWGTALQQVASQALETLISSLVKVGLQYLVNLAISEAALATSTASSVAAAAVTATAWTPAAGAVSLATFGANSAGALAAISATMAATSAMSLGRGFELGGYTGDGATNQVAGLVHGKEFVMNAQATQRIGVSNLEAMQRGSSSAGSSSVGNTSSGAPQVTITNNGTPQNYQVEGYDDNHIRLIANDVVQSKTPDLVSSHIANPNSSISKSLGRHTTTRRSR